MSPRANNSKVESEANGRAVVNDSPVDCQSREVTEVKFSAENLTRPSVQILPPQPISATKKDIAPKTRDFLGFSSFFAVFSFFENGKTVKIKRFHH